MLSFVGWVEDDAIALLENALDDVRACAQGVELPNPTVYLELSVLLCGDRHIQGEYGPAPPMRVSRQIQHYESFIVVFFP